MLLDLVSFCIVLDIIPQDVNDPKDVSGVLSPVMRIQEGHPVAWSKPLRHWLPRRWSIPAQEGLLRASSGGPTITTLEVTLVAWRPSTHTFASPTYQS